MGGQLRHGGRGGAALTRQYIYSRFKPLPWRFSDAIDASVHVASLTAGCFWDMEQFSKMPTLLIGNRGGSICRFNYQVPMPMWEVPAHEQAITSVAVWGTPSATRVLTASEAEARVWNIDLNHEGGMMRDVPLLELPDCANAIFDTTYKHVIGTASKCVPPSCRRGLAV
jgi:hypothetical protein